MGIFLPCELIRSTIELLEKYVLLLINEVMLGYPDDQVPVLGNLVHHSVDHLLTSGVHPLLNQVAPLE